MNSNSSKIKQEEYQKWQGYANALLLALTVLFAGTTISQPKSVVAVSIISIVFGLVGILLTVLWFAREDNHKILDKPLFLWLASVSLGAQAAFLFISLVAGLLTNS